VTYNSDQRNAASILILGARDEARTARSSIGPAIEHAELALSLPVSPSWHGDSEIEFEEIRKTQGLLISPGSPVEPHGRILRAIGIAREAGIPCIGTCGGFQRVLAEYALKVLGYSSIAYQENSPEAADPLFSALPCSFSGSEASVILRPDSRVAKLYGVPESRERFYCAYGINPTHRERIQSQEALVCASDALGEPRILALQNHPFFVATLFAPQASSSPERPHPLIVELVKASHAQGILQARSFA